MPRASERSSARGTAERRRSLDEPLLSNASTVIEKLSSGEDDVSVTAAAQNNEVYPSYESSRLIIPNERSYEKEPASPERSFQLQLNKCESGSSQKIDSSPAAASSSSAAKAWSPGTV